MFLSRLFRVNIVIFLLCVFFCLHLGISYGYEGECIEYSIGPLGGKAQYIDLGFKELEGRKVKLTVFKVAVFGFKDTETIYSDPDTQLPLKVERDISWWLGKEHLIEVYDQRDFKLIITKFKGKTKVSEQAIVSDGPIYNAILVPFCLRRTTNLSPGWSFAFRIPQKFEAKLVSIDKIKVSNQQFSSYHFVSTPDKFEIWISDDDNRIPLKIKGKGGLNYYLVMKNYSPGNNLNMKVIGDAKIQH